ncbi:hypothetical protein GQ457_15G023600 [Hibiscus cannabinus]
MMFRGLKPGNSLGIFKWGRGRESSLTTCFLGDVPPEIELSDYGRVPPSPGSDSSSGLLNGEIQNVDQLLSQTCSLSGSIATPAAVRKGFGA